MPITIVISNPSPREERGLDTWTCSKVSISVEHYKEAPLGFE